MEIYFDLKLSKSQQEMYDLIQNPKYKYVTIIASRQQGKSILMMVLCIQWLLEKKNSIAYVCRNFVLAKKLYRDLIRIIPKETIKSTNGTDLFIESRQGSTLTFASAEQGHSLRGQTYTHLIADEFAYHRQELPDGGHLFYDILSPTLKARGKKFVGITTPLGKNNIAYEFYLRGLSDEYPEYASIIKTIYDDGFVTPQQIEEIKKSIPQMSFECEYLCKFLDSSLTFFRGFEDCFNEFTFNENGKKWIGIDLSANGDDNTIVTVINESNQVKQYQVEGTLDQKYRSIADIINKVKPNAAYLENNGVGAPMIEQIKKLVTHKSNLYEWTTTNSSKEEIISDLAVAIADKSIKFNKDDTKLYSEFGTFITKYTKTGKLQFEAKSGKKDDRIMSLAIALKCKNSFIINVGIGFVKSNIKIIR